MDEPTQAARLQPHPVPTQFTTARLQADDGSTWIILQVETPVGIAMYFLEPSAAVAVGNSLRAEGKAGVSKLVTPTNGLVVPGRP